MILCLAFCSLLIGVSICAAENSVILNQSNSPLKLVRYQASFEPEMRSQYLSNPDQIKHSAVYRNVSNKQIVALQIGFAAFDAFNRLMDRFSGWSIDPISPDTEAKGEWEQRPYAAFSFRHYGTGVAYVYAVRFADGTIWRADLNEVLVEMQKFEKELRKEDIQEKRRP
jgi:hypothetical protein